MEPLSQSPVAPVSAPVGTAGLPAFGVVPAQQYEQAQAVDAANKAAADAKALEMATTQASSLLSYMNQCLNEATLAKQISGITDKLLESQRRRRGEHSPEKLASLKKYNLPVYWVPLTQTKCIHTEAWLRDILMPYADKIWKLGPSEEIELPEKDEKLIHDTAMESASQFMQEGEENMVSDMQIHDLKEKLRKAMKKAKLEDATDRADAMESLIFDQHEECGFRGVFREFQSNLATYGTAFLKGPFTVNKKMPKWVNNQRVIEDVVIPSCSSPSPHDMFPAPWAKDEQDGYIIERIKTYREGLSTVRKLPYWQTKNVEDLLANQQTSGSSTILYGDYQRNAQEDKSQIPVDNRIEIFQFSGPVPGYMLESWGLLDIDVSRAYNMEVVWNRNFILKVMPAWDDTGIRPYYKAVFKVVPGSFWGVGVPLLMSASQDRANMMMISLLDNTNWGTGFIGWVDTNRVANVDDIREMHSKKFIATNSQPGQTGAPMGVIQMDLKVAELNSLYERCLSDADNESGVPAYMYGSGASGAAGGTYSGLSTLMNAAARGIKDALLEIDQVMIKFVQRWADWNHQYTDREDIKGDIRVICSGATGLFVQEMMLDKLDALIAQSVPFMPITGPAFIIGMLRQKAHALRVDISDLPTDQELLDAKKAASESQPTPIKPSLNIACKWENMTPEERGAVMKQTIGIDENAPEVVPNLPPGPNQGQHVATTGTPAKLPSNSPGSQEMSANGNVKPVTPISK